MRPLFVRLATHYLGTLHRALYRASGGRIGSHIWGLPIVLLTTTGRQSGRPRTVPLCSLQQGESYVVIASYGGLERSPAWWLNLQRDPRATVQLGSSIRSVVARETTDGERDRLTPRSPTRCYSARNRQAKIGIQAVTIGSRPHDQTKRW